MVFRKVSFFLCLMLVGTVQVFAGLDPVHAKLFDAVQSGNRKHVNLLLKKCPGIDINKLNEDNKTVLDIAAEYERIKIAADLLKYNAKVTTNQNAGRLRKLFSKRAIMFFVVGIFFTPLLWIGSIMALNNSNQILLLSYNHLGY